MRNLGPDLSRVVMSQVTAMIIDDRGVGERVVDRSQRTF
jgi:hypothetical protein